MKDQDKIAINELKPYENNARTHSEEQLELLVNSINEFGFVAPVIIDENNVILVGHGRTEAAKRAGLTEVPYRRITHLTEDQKRAYILADNKLSDMAGWDLQLLDFELEAINLDMTLFGFEEPERNDIELDEDDFDLDAEAEKKPTAKQGDLYKLGRHYLMCGDSTNEDHVHRLMQGTTADLVVTDPPYNVDYEGRTEDKLTIENDNMSEADFMTFLEAAFYNMSNALKEGGAFYVWHALKTVVQFIVALQDQGLEVKQQIVWNKNTMTLGRQDYQWKHEPCLYGWKNGASHYFTDDRKQTTVIDENKPARNDLHPTMKPINLIGQLIQNSSRKGEVVLDLFGGSGSTLIACEGLDRTCYMMEYDPKYCDVIIQRYEQLTGRKAEKING